MKNALFVCILSMSSAYFFAADDQRILRKEIEKSNYQIHHQRRAIFNMMLLISTQKMAHDNYMCWRIDKIQEPLQIIVHTEYELHMQLQNIIKEQSETIEFLELFLKAKICAEGQRKQNN